MTYKSSDFFNTELVICSREVELLRHSDEAPKWPRPISGRRAVNVHASYFVFASTDSVSVTYQDITKVTAYLWLYSSVYMSVAKRYDDGNNSSSRQPEEAADLHCAETFHGT